MLSSFDSGLAFSAVLLFAASAMAWRFCAQCRAAGRLNIRFGAVLFAALACAALAASFAPALLSLVVAVAMLVLSLGSAVLALGAYGLFARPAPPLAAALLLGLALLCGLAACVTGVTVLASTAQIPAVIAMVLLATTRLRDARREALETLAAAAALLFGGMALLDGAVVAMLLFFAACLFGLACASRNSVDTAYVATARRRLGLAIGEARV